MQSVQRLTFCDYFGFIFVSYCLVPNNPVQIEKQIEKRVNNEFRVEYQWSFINFTWNTPDEYQQAIYTKKYIPENVAMAGIKFYKEHLYIAMPRIRSGTPVTLGYVNTNGKYKKNLLITPFPSWNMNVQKDCASLQNVQSMEIDRRGVMWVLDGFRINELTSCPPKIILFDLNHGGQLLHSFIFRNEISLRIGGFLNDLVIDEGDGGWAYITDNSNIDPGLIVYSRQQGRAWKLRDKSMFGDIEASNFTVNGLQYLGLGGIDGIALSPLPKSNEYERFVYYTALSSYNLYAISNRILKNEDFCRTDQWRKFVKYMGRKPSQSDGMYIDNQGNMYFGLLSSSGVGKWNVYEPFNTVKQFQYPPKEFVWPDSFGMDSSGNLYVLTNDINKFFTLNYPLSLTSQVKFRIWKIYTGNKNYMYSG